MLQATLSKTYTCDLDFQEDVQAAVTRLHDAHTSYYFKPECYLHKYVTPYAFDASLVTTGDSAVVRVSFIRGVYYDQYVAAFPELATAVQSALGQSIGLIDGLETVTALNGALLPRVCVLLECEISTTLTHDFFANRA